MQRDQHDREQIQTRQIPVSSQCNLCLRSFSTKHGKNIHLRSCRKGSLPVESTTRVQAVQQDQAEVNASITARSQPTELAQKPSDKKQIRSAVLCVRGSRTTKHQLNMLKTDFSGAEIANLIGKIK